jgi:predicted ATPase/DNA-binding winged helix-turn-helix (wHTH) protein
VDEESFAFGPFRLIPAQRMLFEDEKPLRLGSRALDILVTLVENAGETVPKDQLIARTWPDTVVDEGTLRVHVAALRKALGDGRAGMRYIANIPGRGYTFVAPMVLEQRESAITPSDGAVVDGNLPVPLTRILGRDDVIAALRTQLSQRRFLTIVGPGGIGKTTVAITVAKTLNASYRDGVWFVALSSLADPELVPSALSSVLRISLSGVNPASGLTAWLRDKHALIVLDSCEHVVGAAASIAEAVLKAAPRVHILATSREPLRAEGEWLHRLASLEVPPGSTDLTTEDALKYSAVELFSERASAVAQGFSFGAADLPAVIEICRKLDGVPLALELAAVQVDFFGVNGLAARLDDRFTVLTKGRRTALPRHQTLRAAIDWSYDLLPEIEQLILRRLAVLRGDFTMAAATAVAADDQIKIADVVEGVANLAMKSLVTTDISGELNYHRLLDTTRAYAFEKLEQSGERDRLAHRHAEYYRDLFERAEVEWETRPTVVWLDDYSWSIDNLRTALDWAFSPRGDASLGVALTVAAVPLWMQLSLLEECRGRAEQALAVLSGGARLDTRREMKLQAARLRYR